MPLRDHFDVESMKPASWDMVHGMWPAMLVLDLVEKLPAGFSAGPVVHLGRSAEIDIGAFEPDEFASDPFSNRGEGGVATEILKPSTSFKTALLDEDEYEVQVYDERRGRTLVAVVEIVSPANKDRPENREAFVNKCRALLRNHVCVSIIDTVTVRTANLYRELRRELGYRGPDWDPAIYAATCRMRGNRLDAWEFPLAVGQALPSLPIWLSEQQHVTLELEPSYEKTCSALRPRGM